jgi:hypothetical protein
VPHRSARAAVDSVVLQESHAIAAAASIQHT